MIIITIITIKIMIMIMIMIIKDLYKRRVSMTRFETFTVSLRCE